MPELPFECGGADLAQPHGKVACVSENAFENQPVIGRDGPHHHRNVFSPSVPRQKGHQERRQERGNHGPGARATLHVTIRNRTVTGSILR